MKRGEGLPEWEEICSVAMAVQNMHLVNVFLPGKFFLGAFKYLRIKPLGSDKVHLSENIGLAQQTSLAIFPPSV